MRYTTICRLYILTVRQTNMSNGTKLPPSKYFVCQPGTVSEVHAYCSALCTAPAQLLHVCLQTLQLFPNATSSLRDNAPQTQLTYCVWRAGVPPKILSECREDHEAYDQRITDGVNMRSWYWGFFAHSRRNMKWPYATSICLKVFLNFSITPEAEGCSNELNQGVTPGPSKI